MADLQLTLTSEESKFLAELLENSLRGTLLEEHRTRTPSYREQIIQQENMIKSLLAKLGVPTR